MSLDIRITELAVRVATEINKSNAARGALTNLQTQNKNSVVGAVNELVGLLEAAGADARADVGDLRGLSTTAKGSLVAAVNELSAALGAASNIDDAQADSATTFSSEKITGLIRQSVTDLVDGAPEALDSLREIAAELQGQNNAVEGILAQVGTRVSFGAAQTLSAAQAAQARGNIGAVAKSALGDTDVNLVEIFNAALA